MGAAGGAAGGRWGGGGGGGRRSSEKRYVLIPYEFFFSITLTGDHQGLAVCPKHRQCMQEVVVHFWPTVLMLIPR
jgi:hypothetical protein